MVQLSWVPSSLGQSCVWVKGEVAVMELILTVAFSVFTSVTGIAELWVFAGTAPKFISLLLRFNNSVGGNPGSAQADFLSRTERQSSL